MAVFNRQGLITELLDRTELIRAGSATFLRLTDEQLGFSPAPDCWSIAEVFVHLNLSNQIYIRHILPRVTLAPDTSVNEFRSGWLGDWAYEKIVPRSDGTVFKMRSTRSVIPIKPKDEPKEALHSFHRTCDELDDILRHSSTKDLRRIRIPFHFIPLLHFGLGETLRFLIAHNERHLLQAQRLQHLVPAVI
jgi:DinB superfamily